MTTAEGSTTSNSLSIPVSLFTNHTCTFKYGRQVRGKKKKKKSAVSLLENLCLCFGKLLTLVGGSMK